MRSASREEAVNRLADAVRLVVPKSLERLHELIEFGDEIWKRPDFIWNALVASMSTMGNFHDAQLWKDEGLASRLRFDMLKSLEPDRRRAEIREVLLTAEVRMSDNKAAWLAANFNRIVAGGGPESVKMRLAAAEGREGKIAFLKSFAGIGANYARNIMMELYHPDFRDSIVVDERLKKVGRVVGVDFKANRKAAEEFFLEVARAAGLNGWQLDRVLYWHTDEILEAIS